MEQKQLPDGRTEIRDDDCSFIFERLRPGSLLVVIEGRDKGQFGTAPIDQLTDEIQRFGKLTLLIDASEGAATGPGVTDLWRDFFKSNKSAIESVTVLVGSRFMEFIVGATLHLAQMGRLVTITTDEAAFVHAQERERGAKTSSSDS